jgi:hypothetical protein
MDPEVQCNPRIEVPHLRPFLGVHHLSFQGNDFLVVHRLPYRVVLSPGPDQLEVLVIPLFLAQRPHGAGKERGELPAVDSQVSEGA